MSFTKDFVWGVATSSYQIEGAVSEGGRSESIWDDFCRQPGRVFEGHTGDVACDHYHRFREDVALMKQLGVKAYRFSIAWPRVLPQGTGPVNTEGLKFYSDLVDELLRCGIEPYVTLYHWDLPLALYRQGGWLNPESPYWFEEYTKAVARALGDRVKHFMTFNEPAIFLGLGHVETQHAPGVPLSRRDTLQMVHHVLLAHGRAVQALRREVPGVKVGFAPNSSVCIPASDRPEDVEAARQQYFHGVSSPNALMNVSLWSDPIFFGRYPQEVVDTYGSDMPAWTEEEMQLISQPLDFYGQNIYSGDLWRSGNNGPEHVLYRPGSPKTAIGWHINPDCLYWGCKFLYERYKVPIVITENGMSCHDWVQSDGCVHDPQRIDYLHSHLKALRRAVEEGVPVIGYFQWSLLDNFEWAKGYDDRFGLIYVDFESQKRLPKDSYHWYRETIRTNGENL